MKNIKVERCNIDSSAAALLCDNPHAEVLNQINARQSNTSKLDTEKCVRKHTCANEQDKHPGEFGQTMQCISLSTMVECIAISASAALMHELTFDPFPNPRHYAYLLIQRPHRDVMAHGEAIALVTRSRSYYGRSQPNRILLRLPVRVPRIWLY